MKKRKDFQRWRKHSPVTNLHREIYKELYEKEANLDYKDLDYFEAIRFFHDVTALAEQLALENTLRETRAYEARRVNQPQPLIYRRDEKLKQRVIGHLRSESPVQFPIHHKSIRKWAREEVEITFGHMEESRRKKTEDRWVEVYKSLLKEREQNRQKKIRLLYKNRPMLELSVEYPTWKDPRRVGRRRNQLGSFVQLAITDHLRKKTGKPHHRFAAELLECRRSKSPSARRSMSENVKQKILQLKKSHPAWKRHLRVLDNYLGGLPVFSKGKI